MTVVESLLRGSRDIDPMIEAIKGSLEERRKEGLLREGELFTSLSFYELNPEERKLFRKRLQGFRIPGTRFQLTWVDTREWFAVAPRPTRPT